MHHPRSLGQCHKSHKSNRSKGRPYIKDLDGDELTDSYDENNNTKASLEN
jgi:hypothetical protein